MPANLGKGVTPLEKKLTGLGIIGWEVGRPMLRKSVELAAQQA